MPNLDQLLAKAADSKQGKKYSTGNRPGRTNLSKSETESKTKSETESKTKSETESKTKSILSHHSVNTKSETKSSDPEPLLITKSKTKSILSHHSVNTKSETKSNAGDRGHPEVVGLQLRVLRYLFVSAQNQGGRTTGRIHTEEMAELLGCSVETARCAVQRLEHKKYVRRQTFKRGRGGYTVYQLLSCAIERMALDEQTKSSLSHHSVTTKSETKSETKSDAPVVVVNSLKDIKTNTERLNYEIPSRLKAMGVTHKMLMESPLSDLMLFSSLEAYVYDLENGFKPPVPPLRFILGIIVKNGNEYKSEVLQAREDKAIASYLERREKLEEVKQTQTELDDHIRFEEWKKRQTKEQLLTCVAELEFAKFGSKLYEALLRSFYFENEEKNRTQPLV